MKPSTRPTSASSLVRLPAVTARMRVALRPRLASVSSLKRCILEESWCLRCRMDVEECTARWGEGWII